VPLEPKNGKSEKQRRPARQGFLGFLFNFIRIMNLGAAAPRPRVLLRAGRERGRVRRLISMQTVYIQLRKIGEKSSNRRFPVTLANKARPAFAHEAKAGEHSGIDDFSPKGKGTGKPVKDQNLS
jgi:hypothetical protein